jgi:hypothetical protein
MPIFVGLFPGAPGTIRTSDPQIRSLKVPVRCTWGGATATGLLPARSRRLACFASNNRREPPQAYWRKFGEGEPAGRRQII